MIDMAQVEITVNGREYKITCDVGQEARLQQLAAYFDRHVTELARELGQIGDARLMLLSALTVCDDLFEARNRLNELAETSGDDQAVTVLGASRAIDAAAARINEMAEKLATAR